MPAPFFIYGVEGGHLTGGIYALCTWYKFRDCSA
jgi:hypothetical protein